MPGPGPRYGWMAGLTTSKFATSNVAVAGSSPGRQGPAASGMPSSCRFSASITTCHLVLPGGSGVPAGRPISRLAWAFVE